MADNDLSLEKFGSIGGDYFEHLVAAALDELGYVEGETYIPSWSKRCVPGTWIEADFIVGDKTGTDPENNGRKIFAIGHATSENSAQMKFHRDVEQLLEVKALPNGDEYMVFDILFCCPRETMGGWSEELVRINEGIFDDSLIVWKHDWGRRLLWHIQNLADELKNGDSSQKKKRLRKLLDETGKFNKEFQHLKLAISEMLALKKSKSQIHDMFQLERESRKERINLPLFIKSKEKTEYKRGLLQVLALNDWELELLYENHYRNKSVIISIEKIAIEEKGISQEDFDNWWNRLQLLSEKIGKCSMDFDSDNILDPDEKEVSFFNASVELGYIFDHFDLDAIKEVVINVPSIAPNLVPYLIDLQDLSRIQWACDVLSQIEPNEFFSLCEECYENDPWYDKAMPRLLIFEVAKSAIRTEINEYSYDVIANDSGNPTLISNPFTMRFLAGKRGSIYSEPAKAGLLSVSKRLVKLPKDKFSHCTEIIVRRFIYERFDGMVKQPKGSVLDALLDAEIQSFGNKIGSTITSSNIQGIPSVFNALASTDNAGINVEIPYILKAKEKQILIHRVNANNGHAADKRKEFSSKIRTIRYKKYNDKIEKRKDYYASILVLDGNWIKPGNEDPFSHIKMLTTAGWDYVVYPDGLSDAFRLLEERLREDGLLETTP